jgi:hypothetical protein
MHKEGELRKNRLEELKTRIEKEEQAKVDRSRSAPKKRNEHFSPYRLERGTEERSPKAELQSVPPKPEPKPTAIKAESGKSTATFGHKPQGSKPSTAPGSKSDPPPKPIKHGDVLRTIYEELTSKS